MTSPAPMEAPAPYAVEPRALDLILARSLMGDKPFRTVGGYVPNDLRIHFTRNSLCEGWEPVEWSEVLVYPLPPTHGGAYRLPPYSSDPAAALAVVEAMGERDCAAEMCFNPGRKRWTVFFDGVGAHALASSDSLPRAVCLAAVRALDASGALPPEARALLSGART